MKTGGRYVLITVHLSLSFPKGKKYIIFNTELALKLLLLTAFFCQYIFSTGKN